MNNENIKKYNFHINGMHCRSCSVYIEEVLGDDKNVKNLKVSLANNSLEISGDFGDKSDEEVAEYLSRNIKDRGYLVSCIRVQDKIKWNEFLLAIPIALLVVFIFFLLQKTGLINLIGSGSAGYSTAFLVGIVASLSTCMATVGGLLLSLSANYSKEGNNAKPQIIFHLSRIVSFYILGGIVGLLGSTFKLGVNGMFVLSTIVAIVMIILGINLLDIFNKTRGIQLSFPKIFKKYTDGLSNINNVFAPILIGAATFIIPCGFTQAMQVYALSTGSFMVGGLTMLSFALGTLPVLAFISFSSYSIKKSDNKGIFFKSAGIIVILFAVFNMLNALASISVIKPIFNF